MYSWKEIHTEGIMDARCVIRKLNDNSRAFSAFSAWWNERDISSDESAGNVHLHPSTLQLAEELRAIGLDDAANFATTRWIGAGPIHPGVWTFSILLGESFVTECLLRLVAGANISPNSFYGLAEFGAWDAFDYLLRARLQTNAEASDAAMDRLRLLTIQIKADPIRHAEIHERRHGNLEERIKQYAVSPTIDEAWEGSSDSQIILCETFLWDALLEVRSTDVLALLSDMPHPLFIRNCIQRDRLTKNPNQLAELLTNAPLAFSDQNEFRVSGAVAILLLEIATEALQKVSINVDGSTPIVPADKLELLAPMVEKYQGVLNTIIEAIFIRPDAPQLTWAWLERTIYIGGRRNRLAIRENQAGIVVNMPMLLIKALAERLSWRADWEEWVEKQAALWQVHRAMTVFAVGVFGTEPDRRRLSEALERVLVSGNLEYAGISSAITDKFDLIAAVGGSAVWSLDDPSGWFESTWEKLRPVREQYWRDGSDCRISYSPGELLVLWGFSAYEYLDDSERFRFWSSIEKAVRDAWQTDIFRCGPFWTKALVRLFSYYTLKKDDESIPGQQQIARALLPYISAEHGFMTLLTSLVESNWSIEEIRDAIGCAGFDIKNLVQQFLSMKERVFGMRQADQNEIARFRALAKALDKPN